jgi:hypothetical protein
VRGRVLVGLMVAAAGACPAHAVAEPVSGPHGTIEQTNTSSEPNTPTGTSYTGTYHAAGDPNADPPYMRGMTFYPPEGTRYETSVPERCTATDAEISLRGPAACPAGSHLGAGTTTGKFMGSVNELPIDMFNNTDEVIMVVGSPGVFTVSRGKIAPDQSVTFESPTCFPSINVARCPVDDALQLSSTMTMPPYVRGGRGYLTTPPTCPAVGYWETPVYFWWADGSDETMVTRQPCTQP